MIVYHTGIFRESPRVSDLFGEREKNAMLTFVEMQDNKGQTKKWFMQMVRARKRRINVQDQS